MKILPMLRLKLFFTVFVALLFSQNLKASEVSESDSLALVSLYNSTNGSNWVKSDNWLTGSLKSWYGIVFEEGKVVAINLSGNNLNGELPDELYQLTDLMYIYVSFNSISGSIKSSISNLSKLKVLWASNNTISGVLPSTIGGVDSLKTLYLNSNKISGTLPASIGQLSKLEHINLANNELSGVLPSSIGNLSNLRYLTLSKNMFSGAIPSSVQNLTKLKAFCIDYNKFNEIPDLSGIPTLKNTNELNEFKIQYNYFDFTDLAKNKAALGAEANYFPQRAFTLTNLYNLHPGDVIGFNMPAMSYVDTSDVRNTYRYILDNSEVQAWSGESDYAISSAIYRDNGTYVCQVKHDSFPDLMISINNIRLLPPSGYSWLSLGVKLDGPIVDTIDYDIKALKKVNDAYVEVEVFDTILGMRKEFLLPSGTYLLDLMPKGEDSIFFKKYHKNSLRWVNSQVSTFANRREYAYNITLVEKIYGIGSGEISGTVYESDLFPEDPLFEPKAIDSVKVLLYSNTLSAWVNEQETDSNGNYSFTGLDNGEYAVYIDLPGFIQEKVASMSISDEKPAIDSVNFTLYLQNNVVVGLEQASAPKLSVNEMSVYCDNSGNINIQLGKTPRSDIDIAIYNLSGKFIYNGKMSGVQKTIQLSDLPKGVYILQARTKNSSIAKKFMLK